MSHTFIKTPYKYGKLVLAASGREGDFDSQAVDCPFPFRLDDGRYGMLYIGFDGRGYQSGLAVSDDLIHWHRDGLIMGRGPKGSITEFNAGMNCLLRDNGLFGSGQLKKVNGRYVGTYHAYPKPGYEVGPGVIGLCFSDDLRHWETGAPILRPEDGGAWERGGLYKSHLLEHEGVYYLFYNAKDREDGAWLEQSGMACSRDLVHWERCPANPLLPVGPRGAFDDVFASDPCVYHHDGEWIMFYFGNSSDGHAREGAAFSTDLVHWRKAEDILVDVGEPGAIDTLYAHKPGIIGANGVLYHFYCAVAPKGAGQERGIAVAVSAPNAIREA